YEVGEGDEVFFIGLFSEAPGRKRSQPIVRFGNISLMPREPLLLDLGEGSGRIRADAYLVEARSWGGYSGSPAFVYFPPDRHLDSLKSKGWGPALLGLVQGHYGIEQEVAFTGDILGSGKVPVNAGIAAVIPAQTASVELHHFGEGSFLVPVAPRPMHGMDGRTKPADPYWSSSA
ncbi:MAG: hypothetical protein LC808_09870, partial [Actinobacteria bacterium]|nr:hypothetical protein [Actinomycetota bacterium]